MRLHYLTSKISYLIIFQNLAYEKILYLLSCYGRREFLVLDHGYPIPVGTRSLHSK